MNGKRAAAPAAQGKQSDGNGGTSAKRSRVSRACDQCRASREKCISAGPDSKCQTCSSQNRACSYNEQPKKRGIQPNYIRTLELALAWLLKTSPEAESRLAENLPVFDHALHKLIGGKDLEAAEALHQSWRNSLISKQIEQLLSGTSEIDKYGLLLAQNAETKLGASDDPLPSYRSPPPSAPLEQTAPVGAIIPEENMGSAHLEPFLRTPLESAVRPNHLIKLPENALTLLEYYFAFTHSWLPMTEKYSVLKLMYSYPAEGHPLDQISGAEHAELWSIMALAATQLSDEANRLESRRVAQMLIPSVADNGSFQVPHIRAMILLALIDATEERILAAWLRIGTVVSLLLLFKILEHLGASEKKCRHIHLSAFVLESAIASYLKVSTHFRTSYIDDLGFVDEDGLDEWGPWHDPLESSRQEGQTKAPARSFSTLNELVRISKASVDTSTFTPRATSESTGMVTSILFALLKNASITQGRIQPSVLVANHIKGIGHTATGNRTSQDFGWTVPRSGTSESQPTHPYVSIPNEPQSLQFETSPTFSNVWTPDQSRSQVDLRDDSSATAAIFEEFDALLEHQASNHQSQFMQNLGFAPDVELAEFFGADYQPSDPLLAYLNPTVYGTNGNNIGLAPYRG